jgi:hypothetical protein
MLMITVEVESAIVTVRLDGQLAGPNARDLAHSWPPAACAGRHCPVFVDLDGVTSIDEVGKQFLAGVFREGNVLAAGATTRVVVDEIIRETAGYHPGIDDLDRHSP